MLRLQEEESAPRPPEPLDSYVMVEKSDVLEAIGQFVAAYLASMPEAQDLQPKQLQAALTQTFKARRALLSMSASAQRCCALDVIGGHQLACR